MDPEKLTNKQIRAQLKKAGLSTFGLKPVLVERFKQGVESGAIKIKPKPDKKQADKAAENQNYEKQTSPQARNKRKGIFHEQVILSESDIAENNTSDSSRPSTPQDSDFEEQLSGIEDEINIDKLKQAIETYPKLEVIVDIKRRKKFAYRIKPFLTFTRRKMMKMKKGEQDDKAKRMQLQNDFVKEAQYELQIFNLKEQHTLQLQHMHAQITQLQEDLFLKQLYIQKLHKDLDAKQRTIDFLAKTSQTQEHRNLDEITANWLALQRLFGIASQQ